MTSTDRNTTSDPNDLLTGWSCIVHRPSEDPEPSSLPSTVDIAAFGDVNATLETTATAPLAVTTGIRHEPVIADSNSDTDSDSDESDSENSNTCSQSSSDSDSSSSSVSSTTSSSVTIRKQTHRPTIQTQLPKLKYELNLSSSDSSDINNNTNNYDTESSDDQEDYHAINFKTRTKNDKQVFQHKVLPPPLLSQRNSSRRSVKPTIVTAQKMQKKLPSRRQANNHRCKKMQMCSSSVTGRDRTYSGVSGAVHSDESDSSETEGGMLEDCSLQEIRQEDLAAILPDQQDVSDTFGDGFDADSRPLIAVNQRNVAEITAEASGSDTEFSSQLVNAAIQRVTTGSSSETEAPSTSTYSSSLLQQFVKQTQLLNCGDPTSSENSAATTHDGVDQNLKNGILTDSANRKRRGRPKKENEIHRPLRSVRIVDNELHEYCGVSNVSPDSGIQDSPEHIYYSPDSGPKSDRFAPEPNKNHPLVSEDRNNNHKTNSNVNNTKNSQNESHKSAYNLKPSLLSIATTIRQERPNQYTSSFKKVLHSTDFRKNHLIRLLTVAKNKLSDSKFAKSDLDDLTNDFMNRCYIDLKKPVGKEKKSTKKRKHQEVMCQIDLRKKKRPSIFTKSNDVSDGDGGGDQSKSNEQRLPLKKRHYHGSHHVDVTKENTAPSEIQLTEDSTESITSKLETNQNENNSRETVIKAVHKNSISVPVNDCCTVNKQQDQQIVLGELDRRVLRKKKSGTVSNTVENNGNIKSDTINVVYSINDEDHSKKSIVDSKKRKRRVFNRTGFPNIRKKKKKSISINESNIVPPPPSVAENEPNITKNEESTVNEVVNETVYERVPRIDEEASNFVERMQQQKSPSVLSDDEQKNLNVESSDYEELPLDKRVHLEELVEFNFSSNVSNKKLLCLKTSSSIKKSNMKLSVRSSDRVRKKAQEKFLEQQKALESTVLQANQKRKRYLIAGLYSDYYKCDMKQMIARKQELKNQPILNMYPSSLRELMRPIHYGKKLIHFEMDFLLPYDLLILLKNSKNGSVLNDKDVASWKYRKIRSNLYGCRVTTNICEPQPCTCDDNCCDDQCINRVVFAECPPSHKCSNQRIQRHETAPSIERFMTDDKGWGIRTLAPIKASDYIMEYMGEVVTEQEFKKRMSSIYQNDIHHYCLHLDGGLVIDAHRIGSDGRFVNHSCEPNCEMQKWSVNGQFRMALFALRDIEANEELTYDYNFSLFNLAKGQLCKCGSKDCRGVIGGKSQRLRQSITATPITITTVESSELKQEHKTVIRMRKKKQAKKASTSITTNCKDQSIPSFSIQLSIQQKKFIRDCQCFLIRNYEKVRRCKYNSNLYDSNNTSQPAKNTIDAQTVINNQFVQKLNAIRQQRNVSTRCSIQAQNDPEIFKTANLAVLLKQIYDELVTAKDEKGALLYEEFRVLPSRRKNPEYYQKIQHDPIDFITIEQNIANGVYRRPEQFNDDMLRLVNNAIRYYGRMSDLGIFAVRLLKIFTIAKRTHMEKFEEIIGDKMPKMFFGKHKSSGEEEDVIRCICGLYRDEGVMIQCERCLVWQHCECVSADDKSDSYLCERCVPREVDLEISINNEFTDDGHQCYLSLLRGSLQLRQGDTVYVLRDIPIPGTDKKHTYDTIGDIRYEDLDIFRIERLWKHKETGQRFAYGHHYLRPHETFHEPTRKFFENELLRVPLYEIVPIELIIERCWVMDLNTFCRGRPMDAPEQHIYICEYRVDRTARLFSKIGKMKTTICTKAYAFEKFPERLKISRTFAPHEVDPEVFKNRRKQQQRRLGDVSLTETPVLSNNNNRNNSVPVINNEIMNFDKKKTNLNNILLKLLSRLPTKHAIDLSYLVDVTRRKKRKIIDTQISCFDNNKPV